MIQAKDIMQCDLVTICKDASVFDVIDILGEKGITGIPVVDESMDLLGIVSEKDILTMAYRFICDPEDESVKSKTVGDVMISEVVTFRHDDNLADICQCFLNNPFRRVPVLEDGKLVGIISRKDIIGCAYGKMQKKV